MSNKPDLMTEKDLTPEDVAGHGHFSRQEKLERLSDMKFELERQSGRGTADLEQVEARMASINGAISRVKKDVPTEDDGTVIGRTTSA